MSTTFTPQNGGRISTLYYELGNRASCALVLESLSTLAARYYLLWEKCQEAEARRKDEPEWTGGPHSSCAAMLAESSESLERRASEGGE